MADDLTRRAWIDTLPDEMSGQRRILRGLVDFCERTPRVRWCSVSCSLGRGAGDRLSDADCGIGVEEDAVEAVAAGVAAHDLGERVDTLVQDWPGARPMRRIFIQFTDLTQLDLVVMPGGRGLAPDEVALYDADGGLAERFTPAADLVDGQKVREWTFLGLVALMDLAKYLDRGSLWEAHARLGEARDRIWALWAAARGARYPVFGLSQVLDRDPDDLPPGIESTVAGLDPTALRTAARHAARLLADGWAAAAERCPADFPTELAALVDRRLGPAE